MSQKHSVGMTKTHYLIDGCVSAQANFRWNFDEIFRSDFFFVGVASRVEWRFSVKFRDFWVVEVGLWPFFCCLWWSWGPAETSAWVGWLAVGVRQ
jgi:hypothetical protein